MSTSNGSNRILTARQHLGMELSFPMSRREALRLSLFSTAGLMCGVAGAKAAAAAAPGAEALAQAPAILPVKPIPPHRAAAWPIDLSTVLYSASAFTAAFSNSGTPALPASPSR